VEDRSSNGTMAGDPLLRHRAAEVPYGTPIVVGNYTLYVNLARPAAPPPLPPPKRPSVPVPPSSFSFGAPPLPAMPPAIPPPQASRPAAPPTLIAPLNPELRNTLPAPPAAEVVKAEGESALRREIHAKLLEHLDLAKMDAA